MDNQNKKITDSKYALPPEAFKLSGLTLEEDQAKYVELNKQLIQKFNLENIHENTDFSGLEKAATQALIATIQYINNPALDPKGHPKDIDVRSRRFKAALYIGTLASIQLHATYLQTPEGLQEIEKYKKEQEEKAAFKRFVVKGAAVLVCGALGALLVHASTSL
jgi:hypothetical protein